MAREIKFRAWDADVSEFCYISLLPRKVFEYVNDDAGPLGHHSVNLSAWTQYTGLKDKNGVEIYEGDILSSHHGMYMVSGKPRKHFQVRVVSWADVIEDEGIDSVIGYLVPRPDEEVIGNIYENKDLL